MNSSSANSLSASVQSLKSSLQLLDSSISILDQGISDFPRLSTVLTTTRVHAPILVDPKFYTNSTIALRAYPILLLATRPAISCLGTRASHLYAPKPRRNTPRSSRTSRATAHGKGRAPGRKIVSSRKRTSSFSTKAAAEKECQSGE